jgi:hypothetical protein
MTRTDHDGDPWVVQWTGPDGTVHNLYEDDVDLLRQAAADSVQTDSRFPRWVYVGSSRCTVRDPRNRTFRRLVDLGIIVPGEPQQQRPARPELSTAGLPFDRTIYRLVDTAAVAMLATVR